MALNFPNSPTLGQIYTDATSGFSYEWNGIVWTSYSPSASSQIQLLDDISASFNGSTQIFALTSSGSPVSPASAKSLIVNLGGVIQDSSDDYTVSGSNISFSTPPAAGLSFSGISLGPAIPINTIPNGTVTDGSLRISTSAVVGSATTFTEDLVVGGNARVIGILTVGTSSITLNGYTNQLNVGSGVTVYGNTGIVSSITVSATEDLNVGRDARVIGILNVGSGVTVYGNTGIVSAITVSANEFIGTGDNISFSPKISSFNPTDGATNVSALSSPNISITYDQPIVAGVGTITLRTNSASGTIVESFSVGVSTRVTIGSQSLTIDPTNNFDYNQEYYVVVPQGSVTNYVGGDNSLLDTYNFTTEAGPVATSFSPADEETNVGISSNIVVTFDKNIRAGVGTITLRTDSAVGSIIESYDVSSSGQLTFNSNILTIDPTSNLSYGTVYYIVIPNNAVAGYVGTDTYNFTSINPNFNLFGWGYNFDGRLGQNNITNRSSPVQIPGTTWSSISAGSNGSMATKTDNTLWAWGSNSYGQLGQNNTSAYSSPVQIPGTTWSSISGGNQYSLAIKTDNTLWSWGRNNYGQLGQNDITPRSSPTQVPGNTWSSIDAGSSQHSLATKNDGTLWSCGLNNTGQLGQNNTTYRSSPVQIPGNTWSLVSGGSNHSLATKTDGTLWAWGASSYGPLGQGNSFPPHSSPVQIPGTTWSSISAGSQHSLATKNDGTLWAWGRNLTGQLGQNNTSAYSSPVQIPGTTWSSISTGQHTLATKTDRTLWAWGNNPAGELGQNNTTNYSSPRQIPGNTWTSVSVGNLHSLAIQTN